MNNKIKKSECHNFEKLIPLMIKKKLNAGDYKFFKQHLKKCELCREKYEFMKKVFNDLNSVNNKYVTNTIHSPFKYSVNEYNKAKENVSSYIDNNLTQKENLSVKKWLIGNKYMKNHFLEMNKLIALLKNDAKMYKDKVKRKRRFTDFFNIILKK